jgi:D-ribose pyranase
MKKTALLNKDISEVVAGMGHTDLLCVADAGLPIPAGVRRIDVSVKRGLPGFQDTVETIVTELCVQGIIVAEEIRVANPQIEAGLRQLFPDVSWRFVSHAEFKSMTAQAKAVVRTGEATPYANVILVAGVAF